MYTCRWFGGARAPPAELQWAQKDFQAGSVVENVDSWLPPPMPKKRERAHAREKMGAKAANARVHPHSHSPGGEHHDGEPAAAVHRRARAI